MTNSIRDSVRIRIFPSKFSIMLTPNPVPNIIPIKNT
jgi:hypothetical protein